jgi:hypothetical protein
MMMDKSKGMSKGGMVKKTKGKDKPMSAKMGYAKGGMVKSNCGASMKPNGKSKK